MYVIYVYFFYRNILAANISILSKFYIDCAHVNPTHKTYNFLFKNNCLKKTFSFQDQIQAFHELFLIDNFKLLSVLFH